jgi:intracellular septation protein A
MWEMLTVMWGIRLILCPLVMLMIISWKSNKVIDKLKSFGFTC